MLFQRHRSIVWALLCFLPLAPAAAQSPAMRPADSVRKADDGRFPCHSLHAFDYWEGVFTVQPWEQPDAPSQGTVTTTRDYGGCVFTEKWESAQGGRGTSMVFYDASRKAWRMIWDDDQNGSNDFEGEYRDGAMRFQGWVINGAGRRVMTSNVLQDVSPQIIHHIFSVSADSGKTWNVRSSTRWTRQH